jgi:hypothetical protein
MNDNELNQFFAEVWMYFEESQESAKKKFGVGTFDSWNADITESKLIFENEKRRLVGEIRIIGTVTRSIWTWGWANSKLPDATSKSSEFMKQFDQLTGLEIFNSENLELEEERYWELTALACRHIESDFVYRLPAKQSIHYVTVKIVEDEKKSKALGRPR